MVKSHKQSTSPQGAEQRYLATSIKGSRVAICQNTITIPLNSLIQIIQPLIDLALVKIKCKNMKIILRT